MLCCAGPVLLAGGALGVAGGLRRSSLVLGLAALVLIAAVVVALRHRRSGVSCNAPNAPPDHTTRHTVAPEATQSSDTSTPPRKG